MGTKCCTHVDSTRGDYPRWVDTSTMIADPFTRVMNANRMTTTLQTGTLDLRATPESLAIKARDRALRRGKAQDDDANDVS